jgi:hypothetical protein
MVADEHRDLGAIGIGRRIGSLLRLPSISAPSSVTGLSQPSSCLICWNSSANLPTGKSSLVKSLFFAVPHGSR